MEKLSDNKCQYRADLVGGPTSCWTAKGAGIDPARLVKILTGCITLPGKEVQRVVSTFDFYCSVILQASRALAIARTRREGMVGLLKSNLHRGTVLLFRAAFETGTSGSHQSVCQSGITQSGPATRRRGH